MTYNSFDPSPDLSPYIRCYWTLEAPAEEIPEKQRIVPDGCMEMIFQLGDLYRQYLDEENSIIQPRSFVFGQITKPLDIEPTGITNIFAVRFHPSGFLPFANVPLQQLENKAVALEVLFGTEGKTLFDEISNAVSVEERIKIVEQFLLQKITDPENIDKITSSSVALMLELSGQINVGTLSEQMNVNRRQLERRFSSLIGLSPKQLSKIIRIQATLKLLAENNYENLTSLAYEANYYDQAHFIKDFKEFTGVPPKKFFANNLKMAALFID